MLAFYQDARRRNIAACVHGGKSRLDFSAPPADPRLIRQQPGFGGPRMVRAQDVLFVAFCLIVGALLALGLNVGILALVGAFACGALYLLIGMVPDRDEPFWARAFTTVFLSLVLASLVLILPATLG
ncbi:MAG: hypothetical protein KIT76_18180, partial [Pseudolabrys sp.]|nr:hypothetical protein [Pseudolabrys sp.]